MKVAELFQKCLLKTQKYLSPITTKSFKTFSILDRKVGILTLDFHKNMRVREVMVASHYQEVLAKAIL